MIRIPRLTVIACLCVLSVLPSRAEALEQFCDTAYENCQQVLLQLIEQESIAIDVAFWFMEDARYSAALERAVRERGVKVRVIFDTQEFDDDPHGVRRSVVDQISQAGIPMREKVNSGINHWKFMLFTQQDVVQFSGANHTEEAFRFIEPYINYVDEVIYFTDRPEIVNSFKTMFDNVWTDTSGMMADYANVTLLERAHATYPIAPEMNFAPFESFRQRSVNAYNAEPQGVDAIIYRITDRAHTDALINALARGVRIRLLTEPHQYRDESRLWHAWNVDRLYMAGIEHPIGGAPGAEIRHRGHLGLTHEKLTLLTGQQMVVFGSSNWTSPSSDSQTEHNLFTTDPAFYSWARAHFDRKWFNLGPSPESQAFQPLPPDTPQLTAPADAATAQPLSVPLRWSAGPWAHRYDVYLGTSPNNMVKVLDDVESGPYDQTFTAHGLAANTTYYWRVVSRTMANLSRTSATRSFTTQGAPPGNAPPAVALTSPANNATYGAPGSIAMAASATDSDGSVSRVDFYAGGTLVGSDLSAPFSATWSNVPTGTYSLTARAIDNVGVSATSAPVVVTVTGSAAPLPAPWSAGDIGAVGVGGATNVNGSVWTVSGGGADVWGSADAFHFAYQPLTGDGAITARVRTVQNIDVWTKAGVMIREQLTAGAKHAFMFATPTSSKGLAFQRRVATNGSSAHTGGAAVTAPVWLRITRTGSTISAYSSPDGSAWTLVGAETIAMADSVFIGLAISSHDTTRQATATFDNITVSQTGGPPPPNAPPTVALTSPASGSSFSAPATIALAASASDTDGTIARVEFRDGSTVLGTDTTAPFSFTWTGVAAGSYTLTARAVDNAGAATVSSPVAVTVEASGGGPLPAPWVSQDIGNVGPAGTASVSGGTWSVSGGGTDVWGTADSFHYLHQPLIGDGSIVARVVAVEHADDWTKAGVMIRESLTANSPHAFMIVTPSTIKGLAFQRRTAAGGASMHTDGGALAPPVWVRLTRNGSTISAYRSSNGTNWTPVGTDTIPMAGSVYVGLAVTSHTGTSVATATFDNVTVSQGGSQPPPNAPPTVTLTSPVAGASFNAPATIPLAATAADTDGTISRVEFFAGQTLIGTDSTSPYSLTWSNVPAGGYSLFARAVDDDGAATSSEVVNIQVAAAGPGPLPDGWAHGDIGAVAHPGSATFADGAFVLQGSGADIWGTADAFHFAYRPMTGNGSIVARVDFISWTNQWTKTGVMIRAALTPSSRHAMMVVSPGKGLAFQRRTADGAESVHTAGGAGTAPAWVRLDRNGSVITASVSTDGVTWTAVGSETIDLPATVYVGLPLTSHDNSALAEGRLSNVSVTP